MTADDRRSVGLHEAVEAHQVVEPRGGNRPVDASHREEEHAQANDETRHGSDDTTKEVQEEGDEIVRHPPEAQVDGVARADESANDVISSEAKDVAENHREEYTPVVCESPTEEFLKGAPAQDKDDHSHDRGGEQEGHDAVGGRRSNEGPCETERHSARLEGQLSLTSAEDRRACE